MAASGRHSLSVPADVPYLRCALSTPRISLAPLKTAICHCAAAPSPALVVRVQGGWGRGSTRDGVYGWVREGAIPGTHPPAPLYWYCQDPTNARIPYLPCPPGTPGPPGPSAHLGSRTRRTSLRTNKGRDSGIYILKLVMFPECQRFPLMRPAVVPVSKSRPKCHDLEFPGFHFGQPSLPRNKWSCFEPKAGLSSKRQSVGRMCTTVREGYGLPAAARINTPAARIAHCSSLMLQLDPRRGQAPTGGLAN